MSSFSTQVWNSLHSTYCLNWVLSHEYVCKRACVWPYRIHVCLCLCVHICPFRAILSHSGIVYSLLTKLLNGVTTRAKAFSFFLHLFLSLSLLPYPSACQLVTGEQIGIKSFIFHFGGHHWWPGVLMRGTCEQLAVRLCKGLTLPFESTSAPRKTGKATVWLVDYPSHSQMPSNDYLTTSKVQWCGPPPGSTVLSQWCPHKQIF